MGEHGQLPGSFAGTAGAGPIADVVAHMEQIDATLPRKDGVAYFNRLYLAVTRAVLAAGGHATFENPAFLDRLDVVFADFYFDAESTITSGARCPVPWRPLLEERAERRAPIQFALAGMNAHINNDLPLAVVRTCEELGIEPADGTPQQADYESVNAILGKVETQVSSWFTNGVIADIEDVVPEQVDRALAMWSIVAARELAWDHAQVIWQLRGHQVVMDAYTDILGRTTELAGRAMLV